MSDSEDDTPPKPKKQKIYTRRKQKFNNEWMKNTEYSSWLSPELTNKYKARCTICNVTFTAELTVIKNHLKSKSHNTAVNSKVNQKTINVYAKPTSTVQNHQVFRAEIKISSFLAEHNISFRVMDHLTPLLKDCFPDCKNIQDMHLKSSKCAAVVANVIGASEKENLSIKLKSSLFSILIDESTDISQTQNLCIVVRFYDSEEGKVVSRFWELYQIFNDEDNANEASAEHIFDCITKSFDDNSVPFTNIIGFGSDGCNTMMGNKNSVRTRFENKCPGIYITKCICHSLHLCASSASNVLPSDCEQLAHSVYNHFSLSSKRQFAFKGIQSLLELKNHKILRPAQTRWLSITAVISRLLEQWDALILYFNHLNFDLESKKRKKKNETESEVSKILKLLTDPIIKLYYQFLDWALPKFIGLNKLFQSEKTLITHIHKNITSAYIDLLKTFLISDYVNKTPLNNIDIFDESQYLNIQSIYVGINVMTYFNKPEFSKAPLIYEKIEFLTNCRRFIIEGCNEIKKRFDFDDILLKNLFVINPKEAVSQHSLVTTPSLLPLMSLLPRLVKPNEYQSIDNEWRQLHCFKLPDNIDINDSVDVFWHKIFTYDDKDNIWSFKNLAKFVLNIISLPHSNADCERVFSKINLIKTKSRNKLVTKTINGLLLTNQRVNSNCVKYEPSKDEYFKMKNSLYPKSSEQKNTEECNLRFEDIILLESV